MLYYVKHRLDILAFVKPEKARGEIVLQTMKETSVRERSSPAFALISPALKVKLASRLARKGREEGMAARIVQETERFLLLSAEYPDVRFAPSPLVDEGWHEFILDTREYEAYCMRISGKTIHHVPEDSNPAAPSSIETVRFMDSRGVQYDREIWAGATQKKGCQPGEPPGDCTVGY